MKFILTNRKQEAEFKQIEAQGIAEFQRIGAAGISDQLLRWKEIEATLENVDLTLACACNLSSTLPCP